MTLEKCWDHCASFGDQRYAGLQRGEICYCGSALNNYDVYGATEEAVCEYACTGNNEQKCGGLMSNSVYDLGGGPFDRCHPVIDPADFFNDCKTDWCAYEGPEQLCEDIESYAEACQLQGIPIMNWRASLTGFGCAMECTSHSHYEQCPPGNQPTCANPDAANEPCLEFCHEGCVCDNGYIFEGDACVLKSNCGCVDDDGNYHVQSDAVISETCDESCVCEGPENRPATRGWNCQPYACDGDTVCDYRNNMRGCY
ncbi:alpha-tectorin-like [Amphiura filiformis]|uniref:alpha-tectorin-like n=1 Tax=Amphiura filiformis TaxID=82378 RepID=UPI003B2219A9